MEHLRNLSIFENASEELLCEVSTYMKRRVLDRGRAVCCQGQPGGTLYFIRSGQVRVSIQVLDEEQETLGFLGPGDHFGEMSVLTGELVSATVTTTTMTELDVLDGATFHSLCERYPALYREVSKTLSKRLLESNQRRLSTRLGKVARFVAPFQEEGRENFFGAMASIADTFCEITGKRALAIVPLREGRVEDEDLLRTLGIVQKGAAIETGWQDASDRDRLKGYARVALLLSEDSHRWYRVGKRWNLLVWKCTEGKGQNCWKDRLEEILFQLRPIYAQILVSQIDWPLEAILESQLPDDRVAFLFDLTAESCQRQATRAEFESFVPEGNRYTPEPGETYWVLSDGVLERLREFRTSLAEKGLSTGNLKAVLLHRKDRPILDYSRVRSILPGISVHTLPLTEKSDGEEPVVPTGDLSIALAVGRRPALARGKLARDLAGMQVGLALGGGGARGLAHIGVIRTLEEEGIPIDLIAGSSLGAVVAGAYAEGRPAERLQDDMRHHWSRLGNFLFDVLDYTFPRTNLLRGRKIKRMIETAMKDATIQDCQVPLFVVCTDLITGREIVLEEGSLGEAIRASGSLPGIFKPVWWGECLMVDGAVLNKVPARVLQQKGARVILAVNVTPERDTVLLPKETRSRSVLGNLVAAVPPFRYWQTHPNILRILSRSLSISGLHQSRIHSDAIDVEIKPRIEHFDFLRFDQYDEIVEAGAQAAREALPEIRRAIEKKSAGSR